MTRKCLLAAFFAAALAGAVGSASAAEDEAYYVSPRGASWALALQLGGSGLQPTGEASSRDGSARKFAASDQSMRFLLTAFLEPAPGPEVTDAAACREAYWGRLKDFPLEAKNLTRTERPGLALLQRDFEMGNDPAGGQPVIQRDLHAYLYKSGYCADVHVSKNYFTAEDSALLDNLVKGISIKGARGGSGAAETGLADVTAAARDKDLAAGSRFFLEQNYIRAAAHYQRYVNAQKKKRTASDRVLIMAIDNLGMSYGQNEEYEKAVGVFNYGLKLFPGYPTFSYNKACAYAEQGDLEKTLASLTKAYKDSEKKGVRLPKASEDTSFAQFWAEPRFARLVGDR